MNKRKLTPREEFVINIRFGLKENESVSIYGEIAKRLNISIKRVRRVERKAIIKLMANYKEMFKVE